MWLVFALLSPICWAAVHVLDQHFVERVFTRSWMGVVVSAICTMAIGACLLPLGGWLGLRGISIDLVVGAIVAGCLLQASQLCYFRALADSDAGIVAAYWNLTPAMLPIANYIAIGERLSTPRYLAIVTMVGISVAFCLLDSNKRARWMTLALMLLASALQVLAIMLEKHIFTGAAFAEGFVVVMSGTVLAGLAPLLRRTLRREMQAQWPVLRGAWKALLTVEAVNVLALCFSQKAVSLGDTSLVVAVETTVPAYTFVLSGALVVATRGRLGSLEAKRAWGLKLLLLVLSFWTIRILWAGANV